jgi:hypothetical protein
VRRICVSIAFEEDRSVGGPGFPRKNGAGKIVRFYVRPEIGINIGVTRTWRAGRGEKKYTAKHHSGNSLH